MARNLVWSARREKRAGMDELLVIDFHQLQGFGTQMKLVALIIDRLYPGEEFGVHIDGVVMGGETGRLGGLDLLQRVVGIGRSEIGKDIRRPVQHLARAFQRHDGVVEIGRSGIGGDGGDFGALFFHALFQPGLEIAVLDMGEIGRVIGKRAGLFEDVARRGHGLTHAWQHQD